MQINESEKKPLMSLAIFTFNQEEYIEYAIEGAFLQDYDNLEIIISDDCSADNTVAVVKEYIKNYEGPHSIVLNFNEENIGTVAHTQKVADIATGEVLIMSAGDDISLPNRVSEISKVWQSERPAAMISNYQLIDDQGVIKNPNYIPHQKSNVGIFLTGSINSLSIHGASSAYDINFIRISPVLNGKYLFEDVFMTYIVYLNAGNVRHLDDALVKYRSHEFSISNKDSKCNSFSMNKKNELASYYYFVNKVEMQKKIIDLLSNSKESHKHLSSLLKCQYLKLGWYDSGLLSRFFKISKVRDASVLKWMLPRFLGLNIYVVIKTIMRK